MAADYLCPIIVTKLCSTARASAPASALTKFHTSAVAVESIVSALRFLMMISSDSYTRNIIYETVCGGLDVYQWYIPLCYLFVTHMFMLNQEPNCRTALVTLVCSIFSIDLLPFAHLFLLMSPSLGYSEHGRGRVDCRARDSPTYTIG